MSVDSAKSVWLPFSGVADFSFWGYLSVISFHCACLFPSPLCSKHFLSGTLHGERTRMKTCFLSGPVSRLALCSQSPVKITRHQSLCFFLFLFSLLRPGPCILVCPWTCFAFKDDLNFWPFCFYFLSSGITAPPWQGVLVFKTSRSDSQECEKTQFKQ